MFVCPLWAVALKTPQSSCRPKTPRKKRICEVCYVNCRRRCFDTSLSKIRYESRDVCNIVSFVVCCLFAFVCMLAQMQKPYKKRKALTFHPACALRKLSLLFFSRLAYGTRFPFLCAAYNPQPVTPLLGARVAK